MSKLRNIFWTSIILALLFLALIFIFKTITYEPIYESNKNSVVPETDKIKNKIETEVPEGKG